MWRNIFEHEPFTDAMGAVEMAAEGDRRIHGEIQADVAIEVAVGRGMLRASEIFRRGGYIHG